MYLYPQGDVCLYGDQFVTWNVLWETSIQNKARHKYLRKLHANWSVLRTAELEVSQLKLRH
jgi:hypothetical protein